MTIQTLPDAPSVHTVASARTVNPWAVVGLVANFLREEGVLPNGSAQSAEASRERVDAARALLSAFGVDPVTAAERAARHATGGVR